MRRSISERPLIMLKNPLSDIAESYRTLRTNIEYLSMDQPPVTIAVTSANPKEGKTTIALNLAIAFAQSHKKVLLIDADFRQPVIQQQFAIKSEMGLSKVIAGQDLQEAIQPSELERLSILPSGPIPYNPAELLSSGRMTEILTEVKGLYDVVLLDTSPLNAVADAKIVAAKCDGVLLVVNSGRTKRQALRAAKAGLDNVKAKLLGVVMNNWKSKKDSYSVRAAK